VLSSTELVKEAGLEITEKTKYILLSREKACQYRDKSRKHTFGNVTVQIFWNDSNKSKFELGGN
jgi:hypothetical protein